MGFIAKIRSLEPRLRVMLIATACLIVPQIGQISVISSTNATGKESGLAFAFMFASIFFISTSVILSSVIMWTMRREWQDHRPIMLLGSLNLLLAINFIWFFFSPCGWTQTFGIVLRGCSA